MKSNSTIKKDAYYFSHDSNARNDIKHVRLRRKYGLEGYGAFWAVVECLREQSNYELSLEAIPDLAFELHIEEGKLKSIIQDFELFIVEGNIFYSGRLKRSMDEYNNKKRQLSDAGKRGNEKRWSKKLDPLTIATQSPPDPDPIALKERKVNKNKIKEIKEEVRDYVTLAPSEIDKLKNEFGEEGYSWMIDKLNYAKGANNKLQYDSDYMAIRKWVVKVYNEEQATIYKKAERKFVA